MDDESESKLFDEAADFGDEVLELVSNGFFCVAWVLLPSPYDGDEGPISSGDEEPASATGMSGSAFWTAGTSARHPRLTVCPPRAVPHSSSMALLGL
jgi:hypothetical protein